MQVYWEKSYDIKLSSWKLYIDDHICRDEGEIKGMEGREFEIITRVCWLALDPHSRIQKLLKN
jgi:hypothetical protein